MSRKNAYEMQLGVAQSLRRVANKLGKCETDKEGEECKLNPNEALTSKQQWKGNLRTIIEAVHERVAAHRHTATCKAIEGVHALRVNWCACNSRPCFIKDSLSNLKSMQHSQARDPPSQPFEPDLQRHHSQKERPPLYQSQAQQLHDRLLACQPAALCMYNGSICVRAPVLYCL